MDLSKHIASIPDFPIKGIIFRDVTSILTDSEAFTFTIDKLAEFAKSVNADVIIGPESRGFIFGAPVAFKLSIGFVAARKPGKLPRKAISYDYQLEYGTNTIEIHEDSIKPGQKVVIIDDLLATGGTVFACKKLVEQLGGEVVGSAFVIELDDLKGRDEVGCPVFSLVHYQGE